MPNVSSFLASSKTALIASVSIISVLFLIGAILFIWWVDTKKRPFKEFLRIIGDRFALIWGDICSIFHIGGTVKTVYSDKTLNYSGTEFLPIPTKAPTNQYSYEFVGWDKNGVDENGNIVVSAIYLQKVAMCKISVFGADKSTLLGTFDVEYGSGLNLSELKPIKNDTKEFTYEFVGWDKETDAFYSDEKIYPVYNAIPKRFTYKFLEEDGVTVVSEGSAIYGTPIIAPSAPKKESNGRGLFEFAGWKGYDNNTILTRDIQFYASYDFKPFGKEGTSTIIKDDGETLKIVEEAKLTPEEDLNHEKIQQSINESHVSFDTETDEKKDEVTEIKMGSSGVIRKRNGGYVQMNDSSDVEKFKKINTGEHKSNNDDEVHQKIQLMTVKKTTEVETPKAEEKKVITVTPKNEPITEVDILSNMMINKIKIEKKQSPIADTSKKEEESKSTKSTRTTKTTKTTSQSDENK